MKLHPRYTPTIMDGPVIRWEGGFRRGTYRDMATGEARAEWSAEISASRNGVCVAGVWPILASAESVEAFATTLRRALDAHERLAAATRRGDPHALAEAIVATEMEEGSAER
jgi:hypothetical protein